MDSSRTAEGTEGAGEEPLGPSQNLGPGETLLKYAENIGIKKFYFTAYLTNKRLFFIDRDEKRPGVTAKEIPVDAIVDCILETPENADPIIAISVKTSDDEIRIMKLVFYEGGVDRTPEMDEWIRLIRQGPKRTEDRVVARAPPASAIPKSQVPRPTPPPVTRASPPPETVREPSARSRVPTPFQRGEEQDIREIPVFREQSPVPAIVREQKVQEEIKTPNAPEHEREEPGAQPVIMFCHHCGKKIPPNANFCPFCGTKVHHPH